MSDRKYRQHGYQSNDGAPPRQAPQDRGPKVSREGPRPMRMPGFQELLRCAMCGAVVPLTVEISLESQCPKCHADLRSCKNCRYFDTGAQFECTQPVSARIMKKDVRTDCQYFIARTSIERETRDAGGGSARPSSARSAFDDLFKK